MEIAPGKVYVRFIYLPAYLVLPELFSLFDNILVKYQSVTDVSHLLQVAYSFFISFATICQCARNGKARFWRATITIFVEIGPITFRDIGILGAAISLLVLSWRTRESSPSGQNFDHT